jgi:hypothetical protein
MQTLASHTTRACGSWSRPAEPVGARVVMTTRSASAPNQPPLRLVGLLAAARPPAARRCYSALRAGRMTDCGLACVAPLSENACSTEVRFGNDVAVTPPVGT